LVEDHHGAVQGLDIVDTGGSCRTVVDQLTPYAPAVAERLQAMEHDVLA